MSLNMLSNIIITILASSLLGLVGGLLFLWQSSALKKFSHFFISFAAGAMLAAVFFDVLPELLEHGAEHGLALEKSLFWVLIGIVGFYALEQMLIIYHCHGDENCQIHSGSSALIIIGDTLHNFLDGILIAGSFFIDPGLGIITTVAVLFHELPQEISDFAVLTHNGLSKAKTIFYNILSALASLIGGLMVYFLNQDLENLSLFLLPIVAGNFLYVAVADLIPMTRDRSSLHMAFHFVTLIIGVAVMMVLEQLVHAH